MPRKCWYCDHFVPTLVSTNQGQCRKYAPIGFDSNILSDMADQTQIFAQIYDGLIEWCGDFKPASGEVPEPS
jgi:hypothetical protein